MDGPVGHPDPLTRQRSEEGCYLAEKKTCRRFPKPASPDLFNGTARNFQVLDALDFIAELTRHIPDPRKHLVRYFGFYSNKSRGTRAKTADDTPHEQHDVPIGLPDPPTMGQRRGRYAGPPSQGP